MSHKFSFYWLNLLFFFAGFSKAAITNFDGQGNLKYNCQDRMVFQEVISYHKFEGKIGNSEVVMELKVTDSYISGRYFYKKIGIPISISGSLDKQRKFKITEYTSSESSAMFIGSFVSDELISGNWISTDGKKNLPFSLSWSNKIGAKVFYEVKSAKYCSEVKGASKNDILLDTACSTLEVEVIRIETSVPFLNEKINRKITQLICGANPFGSSKNSIEELLNSVNASGEEAGSFQSSTSVDILNNDTKIFSIAITQSDYAFGAAHPTASYLVYNFEMSSGNIIVLKDLMINGYKKQLNAIGEKNFIKANGSEGWDFQRGNFVLNDNFSILPGGLEFTFNQYEIGAYAMGAPSVFIPYSQIKHLINPGGLLKDKIKK